MYTAWRKVILGTEKNGRSAINIFGKDIFFQTGSFKMKLFSVWSEPHKRYIARYQTLSGVYGDHE